MIHCGFDNEISLKAINDSSIKQVESYVNKNLNILDSLSCHHKESYQHQKQFAFLPAHSIALTNEANFTHSGTQDVFENPAFSPLLRALIESAIQNYGKDPNGFRYSELLHNFSMYIYMLVGKANYEIISANLPIPKVTTISKTNNLICIFFVFHMMFIVIVFSRSKKNPRQQRANY